MHCKESQHPILISENKGMCVVEWKKGKNILKKDVILDFYSSFQT